MKKIGFPTELEYAMYYEPYFKLVDKNTSVLDQLKTNAKEITELLKRCSVEQLQYRYAVGKWSIKDILQHLMDVERIFIYRALRFARKDTTPLPFFDENLFAKVANAEAISIKKLLKEYTTCRNATISFFNNMDAAKQKATGIASNYTMSVRACAWIICAHELHHLQIIKERYLVVY
jgi:uncharacterized damage-inducible protein DinB